MKEPRTNAPSSPDLPPKSYGLHGKLRFLFAGSLRRVLIVLVLSSVLPALGIILYTGLEARKHALREAESSALLLARSVGEIQGRATLSIRQLLQVSSKSPCMRDPRSEAASAFMGSVIAANPLLSNINVADLGGDILASTSPVEDINLADRSYFQAALRTNAFVAGEFLIGKVSSVPVFPFGAPIFDDNERPVGVIAAGVRLGETYETLFQDAELPKDSVLGITDRHGTRICRYPKDESIPLGQSVPQAVWETVTGPNDQGTFLREGVDGVRRIYAFTRLRLEPNDQPYLYIFVGIPEKHGLYAANFLLRRNLLLMALAALLALGTSWFLGKLMLGRQIERLVRVTEKVGEGDLTTRIGPTASRGELGRLERSVDRMAESLARDSERRKHAEEALQEANAELEHRVDSRTRELREANSKLIKEIRRRTRAQKALRQSEKKHRALYEQSSVGIFVMDPQWVILDANPAALNLLGYSIEEIKGLEYRTLIQPDNLAAVPIHSEAILSGRVANAERIFVARDGRDIPVDVSGRRVSPKVLQVVFNDATERKKLEQLREDVERITRHDLKTPLLGIVHVPAMLLKNDNLTTKQREFLQLMQDAGYRMLRTINMSLALYKMEAKTYQCEPEPFDILKTVSQLFGSTRHFAESKGVSLDVTLDAHQPDPSSRFIVAGEEHLCLTLLENLIKNAIEASPNGQCVRLNFETRERLLTIWNKGEVPPGIRNNFFEKYTTSGKKWGTGLGTYSARLIAEVHGWNIRLDCSVQGETTISLAFSHP